MENKEIRGEKTAHKSTGVTIFCRHLTERMSHEHIIHNCLFKLGRCFFINKAS